MQPERWQQVEALYHAALECEPAARAAFLAEACTGDEALRSKVAALLAYDETTNNFIEQPALEMAAQVIAEEQATLPIQLQAGQQLGGYQLQELLGRGGMGEVYLARDTRLQRKVAIKLLPARFTTDADRVRRFAQEARAASALNHPNILTIHEIGEIENTHYIVTEYVAGETLRQRLTNAPHKQLRLTAALTIIAQMAEALVAAHEAGIVHRDIKPENVMVRPDGYVKILDFGLAKLIEPNAPGVGVPVPPSTTSLTEAGVVMGTPRYMSPEQARGARVDARTDIFSLGVMLYEMATGRAPFAGTTPSEVIAAILRDAPAPLAHSAAAAPPELQHIVDRALQKDRAARYPAMPEMLADLKRLQRQLERQEEVPPPLSPLLSEVATLRLDTAVETAEPAAVTTAPQFSRLLKHHKLSVAIVLLAAVAIAAVYFNPFGARTSAIDSLAVLPFVNVGANPEAEYLSDGITDSLINGLSRLPKLKMMSRNSVFRYKGKDADAQQVGNTLGVRAVLTGKVTQRGDELFISAELIDVRDNSHLWGEQYSYKMSNLPAVQSDLARDVSQQLRLKLSSAEQQQLTKRGTDNPEAYELYLRGRYRMNDLSQDGAQKSLDYFQQAMEKDKDFALAYAGFAEAFAMAAYAATTPFAAPKEARAKAKEAALMAVKLDDSRAETHTALALVAMLQEWDWQTAEQEFKRAVALNPNYVPALHWYSHYFIYLERFAESLAVSERALALDPLDVGMNYHMGFHYFNARQYDQAIAALQKTLELNQNHSGAHSVLGLVYEQQRRYQEALVELQKTSELRGGDSQGSLERMYAAVGQRDEAEKLLAQLLEERKHKYVNQGFN